MRRTGWLMLQSDQPRAEAGLRECSRRQEDGGRLVEASVEAEESVGLAADAHAVHLGHALQVLHRREGGIADNTGVRVFKSGQQRWERHQRPHSPMNSTAPWWNAHASSLVH